MPIPRLTMACGLSIMSMALCAMTLRSFMGRAAIDEMGALTSPETVNALFLNECHAAYRWCWACIPHL